MERFIGILVLLLTACQPATPLPPISAVVGEEFTIAPGQMVTIVETGLSITLVGVPGDERCPLQIECAASGPVTVIIKVEFYSADVIMEVTLQTFTDNDGRAPEFEFEGIQDRVEYEGYLIQVESVLPFPQQSISEIGDMDYRVSFTVTK